MRFFEEAEKEFVLLVGGDRVERVGHGFCGRLTKTDFDGDGLFEGPLGEAFDFGGNGGGEKESLAFFGAEGDDAFDVGKKAHIEHAVYLIQNKMREISEVQVALSDEIEKASGGGD